MQTSSSLPAEGVTHRPLWDIWLRWTLFCAAGEVLGIAIAAGVVATLYAAWGEPEDWPRKVITLVAVTLAGALEGFLVGSFQWRVLRERVPSVPARSWIRVTTAFAALGWLTGMAPPVLLTVASSTPAGSRDLTPVLVAVLAMPFGLVLGAAFGGAQWLVLRRYAWNAGQWVLGNALGWAVAMAWIFLFASLPTEETNILTIIVLGAAGGCLAGLSLGAVTGLFLLRLRPTIPFRSWHPNSS